MSTLSIRNRLLYFGVSVGLLGITSLLTIPFMIEASGVARWSSAAVGQAVGAVVYVLLLYGWGVNGPAMVAAASSDKRPKLYAESLVTRLALTTLVLPVGVLGVALLVPQHPGYAVWGLLSTGLAGLTAGWYFTGTGEAQRLLTFDTLPRIAGTLSGIVSLAAFSAPAWVCLAGTAVGLVVAACLPTRHILQGRGLRSLQLSPGIARKVLARQRAAALTGLVGAGYLALPIILVAQLNPAALAAFALLDKISKQAVTAFGPVLSVLQGWVPAASETHLVAARARAAGVCSLVVSIAAVCGFGLAGGWLADVLGRSAVSPSQPAVWATALATGLYMFEAVVSRAIFLPLVGIDGMVMTTVVGASVGLALVAALVPSMGATGGMLGFAAGLALRSAVLIAMLTTRTVTDAR